MTRMADDLVAPSVVDLAVWMAATLVVTRADWTVGIRVVDWVVDWVVPSVDDSDDMMAVMSGVKMVEA